MAINPQFGSGAVDALAILAPNVASVAATRLTTLQVIDRCYTGPLFFHREDAQDAKRVFSSQRKKSLRALCGLAIRISCLLRKVSN